MPRTSHVDRAQRNSKSSYLLSHCREAVFVGICTATQYDRVTCLAMEYGIGLSAACQEQYHDEHKTSRHARSSSLAGVTIIRNVSLATRSRQQRKRDLIFDEPT